MNTCSRSCSTGWNVLTLLALGSLTLSPSALAVERSADTQLVYPVLSPEGAFAVDTPAAAERWRFLGGIGVQMERMPLEYFENGVSAGAAILTRNTLHLVGSMSLTEATTAFLRINGLYQDPGENVLVAPESQLAMGDLDFGFKSAIIRRPRFKLGPRLDLFVPTGTEQSWASEDSMRYAPSILVDVDTGPVRLLGSVGFIWRNLTNSEADFVLGNEFTSGLAGIIPFSDRTSIIVEATARNGTANFMQPGAENPAELKAGLRYRIPYTGQLDLAVGTALDNGYGAADLRVLATFLRLPPAPPPPKAPIVVEVPPKKQVAVAVNEAEGPDREIQWEEGQLAQVHQGRIVIRDPIQFEFATSNILPESYPTLDAVALVMNDYPQIEHLVIEGHASAEGTNQYNYDLSNSRAERIYEALIADGVRPDRLSYRGLGETVPIIQGDSEEALAKNRRVEFHILKVRDYLDIANADSGDPIVLPWSGEAIEPPKMGDKMLSTDANPILIEEIVQEPTQVDDTPDSATFKEALDDEAEIPEVDIIRSDTSTNGSKNSKKKSQPSDASDASNTDPDEDSVEEQEPESGAQSAEGPSSSDSSEPAGSPPASTEQESQPGTDDTQPQPATESPSSAEDPASHSNDRE